MLRREFITRSLALGGTALLGTRALDAQEATQGDSTGGGSGTSNLFDMNQGAARTVTRPPKRGARPSMNADTRDALEHQIRCQCGCTLDVYTCRTTDFSCQVSPAMHRDVMTLVEGGYSAQEILDAFVGTYGERALMAPKKEGFNWAGYLVPFGALAAGAAAVVVVLRGMQRGSAPAEVPVDGVVVPPLGTDDEMAKLNDAIRNDD